MNRRCSKQQAPVVCRQSHFNALTALKQIRNASSFAWVGLANARVVAAAPMAW